MSTPRGMFSGLCSGSGLVLLFGCLAATAEAGIRELPDGWLHTPAGLVDFRNVSHPEAPPESGRDLWVAAGEGRLYGLPELPQQYLALGVSGGGLSRRWRLRLDIQVCGGEMVRNSRTGAELVWGGSAGVGLGYDQSRLSIDGRQQRSVRTLVLHGYAGGNWGPRRWFRLDAFLRVWLQGESFGGMDDHERLCQLEIGEGRAGLSIRLVRDRRDIPHPDFELLYGDMEPFGLTLRFDPETGTAGPGICLGRPGMLLMTSHLVHPVLGTTHRLMVVLGRWEACRF